MVEKFETRLLEEALSFLKEQPVKVQKKILQNIRRAEQNLDPKFFKKLNNEIWEFRTRYGTIQYRLFAFWDKTEKDLTLVFATHGIIKKTSKIEKRNIEKAKKIRVEYFKLKK